MSGLLGNLDKRSHADLYSLRDKLPVDQQSLVAPYEHRAFAREVIADSPIMALSLSLGIPAYQLAKLLGITQSRTGPSLEQMKQGYVGIGEGLSGLLGGR